MMNELRGLWRGKHAVGKGNTWVEGFLANRAEKNAQIISIEDGWTKYVATKTLGECTGLCDKNGKLIFEGDILLAGDGDTYVVEYRGSWSGFVGRQFGGNPNYNPFLFTVAYQCEVIGNIHDNPELLNATGEDIGNAAQDVLMPAT
ncbi:MAG: YopX family protein [Lachnospiraceae bacterium]|nr:YopX family protein [Ruminococcus sp.]MCM1276240.1 YopX family protein [Lachnospiraceae bacterium]